MPTKAQRKASQRRKEAGLAHCRGCKQDLPHAEFQPSPGRRPFGLASNCRNCDRARKAGVNRRRYTKMTPEERAAHWRERALRKFGLSPEDHAALLESQGGVCAICGLPETDVHHATGKVQNLAIDHDQKTGAVRGLLCALCNKGLGSFLDDQTRLSRAMQYLQRPSTKYRVQEFMLGLSQRRKQKCQT